MQDPLERHSFVFNRQDNGGESLSLTTSYFSNGDPGPGSIFTYQELTLQSYCNHATIGLSGAAITPDMLRTLADELDECKQQVLDGLATGESDDECSSL